MKTIDILGENLYKALITGISLYYCLTDEEKANIREHPLDAVNWIKGAITTININTAENKKILNDGGYVNVEELNNLLNNKRELLRIKDVLDETVDSMRAQALDLVNQIEQLQ